jgi:hypothetical protein
MKRILLTLAAIATTLNFSGCSRDEKTALEEFKKDTLEIKTWSDDQEKKAKGDPMASMTMMKDLVAKMKSIKTDGLPADLKEAWTTALADFDQVALVTADIPKDLTKISADPALAQKMGEVQKKMMELAPKLMADSKKLEEAAKKYGIEGLNKLSQK